MPLFGPPNVEKLKAKGDVNGLTKALGYRNEAAIRQAAATALLQMGRTREVVAAAKKTDDPLAVEALIATLEDRHRVLTSVTEAAAEALGEIGDSRAVEPLVRALKDGAMSTRRVCAEALEELGWEPDRSETGAVYWIARQRWDKCAECGASAVLPLVGALEESWSGGQFDAGAGKIVDALAEIGTPAVERLVVALEDAGEEERKAKLEVGKGAWNRWKRAQDVRKAIVEVLGRIGDVRAVEPLVACLHDDELGWEVATALATVGAPAVEPLIAALGRGSVHAAEALGRIGDTLAVGPLAVALTERDEMMRRAAAKALGQIGDAQAAEPLVVALKDEDWLVRDAAVTALGEIGDTRAVEPLSTTLKDEIVNVRENTARSLGQIGGERAAELLATALRDEWHDARLTAAEALGKIGGTQAVEPLIGALKDESGSVRRVAAKALVGLHKSAGLSDAQKQAILGERDTIVQRHADESSHVDTCFSSEHTHDDTGIGVDFPL